MRLLSLFLLLTLSAFQVHSDDLNLTLGKIDNEDKARIKELFQTLIYDYQFGYVLFGDKAVSRSPDLFSNPMENSWRNIDADRFWKNWVIWKKYSQLFKIKNYLILEESAHYNKNLKFFILINKKSFVETVQKHRKTFEEILHSKIDPQDFLEKIELGHSTFQGAIHYSETLWGILLGYGEHNARLYDRRNELSRHSHPQFLLKSIKPSENFNSIEEERAYLSDSLRTIEEINEWPLSLYGGVRFVADFNHPETKQLIIQYIREREKLIEAYKDKDFLEVTLKQLLTD